MSEHVNPWALAEEAIEEYLTASKSCLEHKKQDGGCLGYPAVLLLLCIVDALGTYLRNEEVIIAGRKQQITHGTPFRVLNHPLFTQDLTQAQIDRIAEASRNRLAHNALIDVGVVLTPVETASAFNFSNNNDVCISVPTLYAVVADAWSHFDKTKIKYAIETFRLSGLRPPLIRKKRE